MQRIEDINELFHSILSNIKEIEQKYEVARKDEDQKNILRPLVKTSLEHLRSILEYSAQDIWDGYNNESRRLYFPYGKDQDKFQQSINRNLPRLEAEHHKVYNLVETIQPHICGNNWLVELCDQTNFNKHNRLSPQVRKNSVSSTVGIGNLVSFDETSTVVFTDCSYNDVSICEGKTTKITGDMSVKQIQDDIGKDVPVVKEFKWVEFQFENSTRDTLSLIKTANTKIVKYIKLLEQEFEDGHLRE